MLNLEFLLQKFLCVRVLRSVMDLAYVLEIAQASQYHRSDDFCNTAKVSIVFLCGFDILKEVY